jgi:thiol-disulfide isomerase/thioredoxin
MIRFLLACSAILFTQVASGFSFTDVNGKPITLAQYQGQWVLVSFWAPWCPLCWAAVPLYNELDKRSDFVVIGVGMDYGPDAGVVSDTASRHGLAYSAIVAGGSRRDPNGAFRQVGPVDFYPTSYLYDPTGKAVLFIPGQPRKERILKTVAEWDAKQRPTLKKPSP